MSAQAVNITTSGSPVAGQSYSLTCTGALLGNASIVSTTTWRNATGRIPVGYGITVSGGTLIFNPLRTSHGGQYICLFTLSYPFNSTATNMTNVIVQSMYQRHIYFLVHSPFPQFLLPLSSSPPHPSLPHTMLVYHSTSPALFSSSHKWTLLSSLTPCGLDQEDRSPVVLVESHSTLVSTRPLYSSIFSTPLILECTTVQLVFLHQVSSMWTPQ